MTREEFIDYYLNNEYDENMFTKDGKINPDYNSFKKTGTIAKIFEDHWDSVYTKNKEIFNRTRPNAASEVAKIIDCYNKNLGCSAYQCPECNKIIFISHTCKSRMCVLLVVTNIKNFV